MTAAPPEVPGYECQRLLGEGAQGAVWLARETEGLRRPVALKVFTPERLAAFERELDVVRRVEELRRSAQASELVQALGSGRAGERGWIALEWLEGGSLDEVLAREGPLAPARAVSVVREAGRALALLHGAGLFHRDVKPQNLLLGADGRVRLGDFGLSRELQGSLSAAGSPAFAAPEVIAGRPVDGRLADVYSLGATLVWLLTGETILPGRPDAFALERRGVARPLTLVLMRACALDPAERTPDVTAFMAELEEATAGAGRTKSGGGDGEGVGRNDPPPERPETPMTPSQTEALIQDVERNVAHRPARTARSAILSLVCALMVLPVMVVAAALMMARAQPKSSPGWSVTRTWDEPADDGKRAYFAERKDENGVRQRFGPHPSPQARNEELQELSRAAEREKRAALEQAMLLLLGLNLGLPLLLEITAIVSGILALSWIGRSAGALSGRGLAIAGLVVAGLNLAGLGLLLAVALLFTVGG